eukprot:SAG11_NODE_7838_length_1090_cov_1.598385_1_plen_82_part_01
MGLRYIDVAYELLPLLCGITVAHLRGKLKDDPTEQKRWAIALREALTRLGPCFIKGGQALSIRPDLVRRSDSRPVLRACALD